MTYQALTDLEQFGVDVTGTIHAAAVSLERRAVFAAAAIAVLALGLAALAAVRARRRKAWLFPRTTPLKFHYSWMAVMAALLVLQINNLSAPGCVGVLILTVLVFAGAVFGLLTWRSFGLAAAVAFIWLALPIRELPFALLGAGDLGDLAAYSVPGKAGILAAGELLFTRALVMELLAAVLTAVLVSYYTRRRYLFRSGREVFAGASACPQCGFPLIEETGFCPACGCEVRGKPVSQPGIEFAVEPRFCTDCGHALKDGKCSRCGAAPTVSQQVKDQLADKAKSFFSGKAAVIAAAVLLFLPTVLNNVPRELTRGVNQANDVFVAKYGQWQADPAVAYDQAWLGSFDDAAARLINTNARGFTMKTDGMNKANLYLYLQYLDASWYQMVVVDRMTEAVHAGDTGAARTLGGYFNGTQNAQLDALRSTMGMIGGRNYLSTLEDAVVDGLRFYFTLPPLQLTAALLLAAGLLCLGWALILRKKTPAEEALAVVGVETMDPSQLRQQRAQGRARQKKERLYAAAGVGIVLLFILAGMGISALRGEREEAPDLASVCEQTYIGSGVPLLDWTALCTSDPAAALADRENALALMAEVRAGLAQIRELADRGEDEEAEKAAAAEALDALLERTQSTLESGALPDQAARTELSRQLFAGMSSVEQSLISQAFEAVEDLF